MLTRQRPFEAETYNQLMFKIATEDPPPIESLNPDVDIELVEVVERAMARDPQVRFQSIEALGAALEPHAIGVTFRLSSSIPGEPAPALSPAPPPAPARLAERTLDNIQGHARIPSVAILGGVAVALVVAGMLLWRFVVSGLVASESVASESVAPSVAVPAQRPAPPAQPVISASAVGQQPPTQAASLPRGIEPTADPEGEIAPLPEPESVPAPARAAPSRKKHSEAKAAKARKTTLAPDWDEHLRAIPAGEAPAPSAGRIDSSDLR